MIVYIVSYEYKRGRFWKRGSSWGFHNIQKAMECEERMKRLPTIYRKVRLNRVQVD